MIKIYAAFIGLVLTTCYVNSCVFLTAIGSGQMYKISLQGDRMLIAGIYRAQSNIDGTASEPVFSRPNEIVAYVIGDTMWMNGSFPTGSSEQNELLPGVIRMVDGICPLPHEVCPLITPTDELIFSKDGVKLEMIYPNLGYNKLIFKYKNCRSYSKYFSECNECQYTHKYVD